jgi:acetaldehyde dehydrogenase/alcohol dehydrogenase
MAVDAKIQNVRHAQAKFATFNQAQVDKIFAAAANAANKARVSLAQLAVNETGMGVVEDKVIKNHFACEYIYNAYKNTKTCGMIESDDSYMNFKIAEPVGVVAAIIPTTNPTSTTVFKALLTLKTRNGLIISPHPRAKACTIAAAKIVLDAAVAAGAPDGIIDWINDPSIEQSAQLMQQCDLILATGGPGMVKSAYSSSKPAIGVGPGNVPAIIDDSADIKMAAASIILSKAFDNGMICASEQAAIVCKNVYQAFKQELINQGAYLLTLKQTKAVSKIILVNGTLNAKIVGQSPINIAKLANIKIPHTSRVLVGEVKNFTVDEPFAHEKLSPILALYQAENFNQAVIIAKQLVKDGGLGHTASLFIDTGANQQDKIKY